MLTQAQDKFSHHLRAALTNTTTGEYDTASMHAAADALVDMRMLYTNRDGQPDLKGASFEYRRSVSDGLAGRRRRRFPPLAVGRRRCATTSATGYAPGSRPRTSGLRA